MNATKAISATATRGVWPLPGARIANARPQPTWTEWSAALAKRSARRQQLGGALFSDRELAHLAFLRWLYQTSQPRPVVRAHAEGR